jgi:hypothetical protein
MKLARSITSCLLALSASDREQDLRAATHILPGHHRIG